MLNFKNSLKSSLRNKEIYFILNLCICLGFIRLQDQESYTQIYTRFIGFYNTIKYAHLAIMVLFTAIIGSSRVISLSVKSDQSAN